MINSTSQEHIHKSGTCNTRKIHKHRAETANCLQRYKSPNLHWNKSHDDTEEIGGKEINEHVIIMSMTSVFILTVHEEMMMMMMITEWFCHPQTGGSQHSSWDEGAFRHDGGTPSPPLGTWPSEAEGRSGEKSSAGAAARRTRSSTSCGA